MRTQGQSQEPILKSHMVAQDFNPNLWEVDTDGSLWLTSLACQPSQIFELQAEKLCLKI